MVMKSQLQLPCNVGVWILYNNKLINDTLKLRALNWSHMYQQQRQPPKATKRMQRRGELGLREVGAKQKATPLGGGGDLLLHGREWEMWRWFASQKQLPPNLAVH